MSTEQDNLEIARRMHKAYAASMGPTTPAWETLDESARKHWLAAAQVGMRDAMDRSGARPHAPDLTTQHQPTEQNSSMTEVAAARAERSEANREAAPGPAQGGTQDASVELGAQRSVGERQATQTPRSNPKPR